MNVKNSIVKGMAWTITEKIGTMLFQMCVSFLILRILIPEDYSAVALLYFFCTLCAVLVDGGLSAALLRKKDVNETEMATVFGYNIIAGMVLYLIMLLAINPISAYYSNMPYLKEIAPVLFLYIPISSFINIQTISYSRRLDFKSITRYTLWASFLSSCVAIVMVYTGFGVWTLVIQRISMPAFRALILWFKGGWRPSANPSFKLFRTMVPYSGSVFTNDFITSLIRGLPTFFIPKLYGSDQLAFYDQAQKIKDMPVQSVMTSIQGVTLPSLAKLQDDTKKMNEAGHKIVAVMNFIMFPVMIGLIVIAWDMFDVFLNEKWMPSVPYLQIFCITGLFMPLQVVTYNVMKIRCSGKTLFRYEMVKKSFAVTVLAITIPLGLKAIVWGQCAIFIAETIANTIGAERQAQWRIKGHWESIMPYFLIALAMGAAVYGIRILLAGMVANHYVLLAEVLTGVAVYVGLSALTKPAAWRDLKDIIRQLTL